jgi:hypothetical protein
VLKPSAPEWIAIYFAAERSYNDEPSLPLCWQIHTVGNTLNLILNITCTPTTESDRSTFEPICSLRLGIHKAPPTCSSRTTSTFGDRWEQCYTYGLHLRRIEHLAW